MSKFISNIVENVTFVLEFLGIALALILVAIIAEKIPSAFIYLSAGFFDERGAYSAHNPKVRFNEEVCPVGASALAYCAVRWLETNE